MPPEFYEFNVAFRLIWVPVNNLEIGHFCLAAWASSSNLALSKPGTTAVQSRSMLVIFGPSSLPRCTDAVVSILVGVRFSLLINADRNIEKQPAD